MKSSERRLLGFEVADPNCVPGDGQSTAQHRAPESGCRTASSRATQKNCATSDGTKQFATTSSNVAPCLVARLKPRALEVLILKLNNRCDGLGSLSLRRWATPPMRCEHQSLTIYLESSSSWRSNPRAPKTVSQSAPPISPKALGMLEYCPIRLSK